MGAETLIFEQVRPGDHSAEALPEVFGVGANHDPLRVPRAVQIRGRCIPERGPGRLPHVSELAVLGHGRLQQSKAALHDRGVDDLTTATTTAAAIPAGLAAARVTAIQGHQHAMDCEHRRQRIPERDPRPRWRLAGVSIDVAKPAHRLSGYGEARAARVRAGLPVSREPSNHKPRIDLPEIIRSEAPSLERARPEVFDQHIGPVRQAQQEISSLGLSQVKRDQLLVPALYGPPERAALISVLSPLAHGVALPGLLDLDNLGTKVSQQAPCEWASDQYAELEGAYPLQRPAHCADAYSSGPCLQLVASPA